jgi:hypothetical protein
MGASTLIFKNSLTDINGAPVNRVGIGLDAAFSKNTVAWQSVLYANSCNNVQTPLTDYGIATVRHCPTNASSCECDGTMRDVGVTAAASSSSAQTGDGVTFTAAVTNHDSSGNASGVTVAIDVPPQVTVTSVTSSQGSCDVPTLLCKAGTLAAGGTATVTVETQASAPGHAAMTFSVAHREADPAVANDGAVAALDID